MADSKILVKDLKSAIISFFENQNPSREIHFTSKSGVETVDSTKSGPINRAEFNDHLQEFYQAEHHLVTLQEEDLVSRVSHLETQLQRQNRTISRLLKEISTLKGKITDLENFSGLTEFENEIRLDNLTKETTLVDSTQANIEP